MRREPKYFDVSVSTDSDVRELFSDFHWWATTKCERAVTFSKVHDGEPLARAFEDYLQHKEDEAARAAANADTD